MQKMPTAVSRSRRGQPPADGVADEGGRLTDVQLAHELDPVGFDGFDAQAQAPGDLLGRLALGDELQDLALSRGQGVRREVGPGQIGRHERPGDPGTQINPALEDVLNGLD